MIRTLLPLLGCLIAGTALAQTSPVPAQEPITLPAPTSQPPVGAQLKPESTYGLRLPSSPTAPVIGPAAQAAPSRAVLAYSAWQRGHYLDAVRWATQAADIEQSAAAMTLLGEFYAEGYGVPRSDAKALDWFKFAAARGDANAMFALGMIALKGKGGEARDLPLAARYFEQAGKAGQVLALYNLGLLYLGGHGVPMSATDAARWFGEAAEKGNADAQYALASLYREGNGVPRDLKTSTQWLARAAAQDLAEAQIDYGIMLFNGTGAEKDEAAGAALFRRAALRGNPVAQNRYARVLATGRGVAADPQAAANWHIFASAQGVSDPWLDDFVKRQSDDIRKKAAATAESWLKPLNTF